MEEESAQAGGKRGISSPAIPATEQRHPVPGPGAGSAASLPSALGGGWGSPTGAPNGGRARPKRPKRECPLCGRQVPRDGYHIEKHLRELEDAGLIKVMRMYGGWAVACFTCNKLHIGAGWETFTRLAEEVVTNSRCR